MVKTLILLTLALFAFAANSVLCRLALEGGWIDPVSFATVRMVSALILLIPLSYTLSKAQGRTSGWKEGAWMSAGALFLYALSFSLAYLSLSSGTGALILFGAVQITMLIVGFLKGERMQPLQWLGFLLAVGGVVYLISPGLQSPPLLGALLMCASGVSWGLYSVFGKGAKGNPIFTTSGNFSRATVLSVVVLIAAVATLDITTKGLIVALICGMITSGLGYVLWYMVLPRVSTTQASVLQLLVPVIAAIGGMAFLSESITTRTVISSVTILGGVFLCIFCRRRA